MKMSWHVSVLGLLEPPKGEKASQAGFIISLSGPDCGSSPAQFNLFLLSFAPFASFAVNALSLGSKKTKGTLSRPLCFALKRCYFFFLAIFFEAFFLAAMFSILPFPLSWMWRS
jgi:hypothetical protein